MYCGKCGTQMEETALFCPRCGEKATAPTPAQPKSPTKKLSLPLGIAAVVLVAVVFLISLVSGGGYKTTLDKYYEAHEERDADLLYNEVVAQYWIDYMNKGWGNSAYESVENSLRENINDWDCGDDITITYEVQNERRATEEELEDLEDNIYDWYAYYVYERDEFSITDAYVLDIDFVVEGEEGTDSFHYPDGLLVIKENGEWRIPRGAINCSFYDNQ